MSDASLDKLLKQFDLSPYAGCWVAIVRGQITGVGLTERDARLASKFQRPKEEPRLVWVPVNSGASPSE
ncbi:hypothetical protein ANRL1_00801 [Anaerolineae bacterium]|nr:hypothetical protein ANRL1_00801 [Anaerolineae bacterium]